MDVFRNLLITSSLRKVSGEGYHHFDYPNRINGT
jgi:hypothetical protein